MGGGIQSNSNSSNSNNEGENAGTQKTGKINLAPKTDTNVKSNYSNKEKRWAKSVGNIKNTL